MSPKLCLLLIAFFGSFQVPITGKTIASSEAISKFAEKLEKIAEELAKKLDELSEKIDKAVEESDSKLVSNISFLEEEWAKKIESSAAQYEACSDQINRLFELSSEVLTSTTQCASDYRQKLLHAQLSSRLQSTSLKYAADKLAGIGVDCVKVNSQMPLCVVSTEPLSALANLLGEGGETLGTGLARAEAYAAQILSCWKQSAAKSASLAHEIIQDIAQCAKAQS